MAYCERCEKLGFSRCLCSKPNTTKTIADITLTLEAGRRYYASRPALRERQRLADVLFTVSIRDDKGETVQTVPGLSYEDANKFLAEFNNGQTSFDGRVW